MGPGKLPRIVKALYGFTDAGDYWPRTLRSVLTDNMGMRPSPSDAPFCSNIMDGKIIGLAVTQVDDIMGAGTSEFNRDSSDMESRFESKLHTHPPFCFAGISITPLTDGIYRLEQPSPKAQVTNKKAPQVELNELSGPHGGLDSLDSAVAGLRTGECEGRHRGDTKHLASTTSGGAVGAAPKEPQSSSSAPPQTKEETS